MSDYIVTESELTDVADAIRTKGGTFMPLSWPTGFVSAINNIPSGGTLQEKTATPTTSQQIIRPDSGYSGLSQVKIAPIPSEYVIPTGSLSITTNNTYNVSSYASAVVNVAGGGLGTLLATESLGTRNITSTNATNLNKSISVSGVNSYDLLIVETTRDSSVMTSGYNLGTVKLVFLTAGTTIGTKNGTAIATATLNFKNIKASTPGSLSSTTAYGIYPSSVTLSSGTATIVMYGRYNSNSSGTINGAYTTRVYGVNLYDLIGG